MEEKLKILHLPMIFEWFDKIATGQKTVEYRKCSDHWNHLFETKHYDLVRFQRGFEKKPATMLFKIKKIHKWYGANDLKLEKVWAIELGERID